jgi:hypothetical protein
MPIFNQLKVKNEMMEILITEMDVQAFVKSNLGIHVLEIPLNAIFEEITL